MNTTRSPALGPPSAGPGLNISTVLPLGTAGSMLSELTVTGSTSHRREASKAAASTTAVVIFFPPKSLPGGPAGLAACLAGLVASRPIGASLPR